MNDFSYNIKQPYQQYETWLAAEASREGAVENHALKISSSESEYWNNKEVSYQKQLDSTYYISSWKSTTSKVCNFFLRVMHVITYLPRLFYYGSKRKIFHKHHVELWDKVQLLTDINQASRQNQAVVRIQQAYREYTARCSAFDDDESSVASDGSFHTAFSGSVLSDGSFHTCFSGEDEEARRIAEDFGDEKDFEEDVDLREGGGLREEDLRRLDALREENDLRRRDAFIDEALGDEEDLTETPLSNEDTVIDDGLFPSSPETVFSVDGESVSAAAELAVELSSRDQCVEMFLRCDPTFGAIMAESLLPRNVTSFVHDEVSGRFTIGLSEKRTASLEGVPGAGQDGVEEDWTVLEGVRLYAAKQITGTFQDGVISFDSGCITGQKTKKVFGMRVPIPGIVPSLVSVVTNPEDNFFRLTGKLGFSGDVDIYKIDFMLILRRALHWQE